MFKNIVETFKKWFKVNQMITEDNIAAAHIAQIFGSELLRVDHNTTERTGPQATRIDPKQILTQGLPQHQFQNNKEKELMAMLQREAENSFPLSEQTILPIQPPQGPQQVIGHSSGSVVQQVPVFDNNIQAIFEKINSNLERIANSLESGDVQVKSKRVRHLK